MCGRYASFLPPEFLARLFATTNPPPNIAPTWNMAPTMDAPVVRLDRESGERHLDALKWGLVPYFTKDLKKAGGRPVRDGRDFGDVPGGFRDAPLPRACCRLLRMA